MTVHVLRAVKVLDAPVSGEVVAVVEKGRDLHVVCFRPPPGQQPDQSPTVRVIDPADGYTTLHHHRNDVFNVSTAEIRSTLATCEE